jgi:hypothetical protein
MRRNPTNRPGFGPRRRFGGSRRPVRVSEGGPSRRFLSSTDDERNYDIVDAAWEEGRQEGEPTRDHSVRDQGDQGADDADPIAMFATSPLRYHDDALESDEERMNPIPDASGVSARCLGAQIPCAEEAEVEISRAREEAIRADERQRFITRFNARRTEAIEEARRAWTALARREDVLRSTVSTHYRMLGRTDILYDPWREGRDSTPALSQAELRDMRASIEEMIYRQVSECDILMSWERFNEVIQCYDYVITQEL